MTPSRRARAWQAAGLRVGLAAVVAGALASRRMLIPLGRLALWRGLAWLRGARQARRLTLREFLTP
ncbi:MAG: hypothetical protein CFK52_12885 [Chloracidobacterium sp. CP2_5A]|nr:MAG: hypothetical protein CFK52_12885 [Chloracidobacterium sp. CP2_5A]